MTLPKKLSTPPFASRWLDPLSSVQLTLSCILLAIALVAAGTLAQIRIGTFEAQKQFFDSWWITTDFGRWKLPIFPGGLTVGTAWLVNLTASFITRFRWKRKDAGIFITHAGLILLLVGQLFTQLLAHESQMPIEVGGSSNYSESLRHTELAVIKTSDPATDEVTSIPERFFRHEGAIHPPQLPFYLVIRKFLPNAQLTMAADTSTSVLATQGIGTRIAAKERPESFSDEERNTPTAWVEIVQGERSLGIWLISPGLGAPQSFQVDGNEYRLSLRPRRTYYPFSLTLKAFNHDIYPGTDIPKNFSSVIQLTHPEIGDSREVLIYMNHPLRYQGKTFYQASFGEGDKISVLQVVDNPAAVTPYLACTLVALGLLIQFLTHLLAFARKRS